MNPRDPRDPTSPFYSCNPDDPDDTRNHDIPSDYFFPRVPKEGDIEYFTAGHGRERIWHAWKFDMEFNELFTTLTAKFNTMTLPLLDIDAFNRDVYEISTIAQDKPEFYRLLAERRDYRQQELLRMWCNSFDEIATSPSLVRGHDPRQQWADAMYIAHWKSFDSYVRYFTGFLEDRVPPSTEIHDTVSTGGQDRSADSRMKPPDPSDGVRQPGSSVRRPAPEACEDGQQEASPRASKKARTDNGPSPQPATRPGTLKRPVPNASEDGQQNASPHASKRVRINEHPTVHTTQPEPLKRRAPDACDDDASRASKRARTDSGEPLHSPDGTPHPLPQPEEEADVAAYWQELARQTKERAEESIRRAQQAEDYVNRAREEYAVFCRNRSQRSGAPDVGSETALSDSDGGDSMAPMFESEDDDPTAVAKVIGPEFAARLRGRESHLHPQSGPQFSWLFPDSSPDEQSEMDNSKDSTGPAENRHLTTTAKAAKPSLEHGRRRWQAGRTRRPRASPPKRRMTHGHAAPDHKQASKPEPRRRTARVAPSGTSPTIENTPQPPRRLTRQSGRGKALYELDYHCSARVV